MVILLDFKKANNNFFISIEFIYILWTGQWNLYINYIYF